MTKPTSNYEMVREFHDAMNVETDLPEYRRDAVNLRMRLINEELKELREELYGDRTDNKMISPKDIDHIKVAKELADLLYVVYGAADVFGILIDGVFAEVHKSNMSKLGEDGKPIYREDGKVLKGPNYKEADVAKVLFK